jgi:hypothetical protein
MNKTLSTETTNLMAELVLCHEKAMQNVAKRALARGATETEAMDAAWEALRRELVRVQREALRRGW